MGKTARKMKTENMKKLKEVVLNVEYYTDFLLAKAIKEMMRNLWNASLFMNQSDTNRTYDVFWADEIDFYADILIQLREQDIFYDLNN